ncbi:MAG TPA: hypothetical protein VFW07_07290 [Parafilimonas sp.]|nr:hypothetical protein [Parafilimonas sp.]
MATETSFTKKFITGKILHKETGNPLQDLTVILFDLNGSTPSETTNTINRSMTFSSVNNMSDILHIYQTARRVGSVLTDAFGKFTFDTDDKKSSESNAAEKKAGFTLLVLSPAEPGIDLQQRLLYFSNDVSMNAGGNESFLIKLGTDLLNQKQVEVPEAATATDDTNVLSKLEKSIQARKTFLAKKQQLFKVQIMKDKQEQMEKRQSEFTTPFLRKISKVSQSFRNSGFFVKEGDSVSNIAIQNIQVKVDEVFKPGAPEAGKQVQGFIYLSKQDEINFQSFKDPSGTFYVLPDSMVESDILPRLYRSASNGPVNAFFQDHPLDRVERSVEADASPTVPNNLGNDTPPMVPAKKEDIPVFIAHQMNTATSPEEQLAAGLPILSFEKRPTNADIIKSIGHTIFQKGPADVPAFYEFHSLKIAFENIWQEAIDLGLIDKAEKWYNQVLANGDDPLRALNNNNLFSFTGIVDSFVDMVGDIATAPVDALTSLTGGAFANNNTSGDNHDLHYDNCVALEFPEAIPIWSRLTSQEKTVLLKLSKLLASPFSDYIGNDDVNAPYSGNVFDLLLKKDDRDGMSYMKSKGKNLVESALERIRENEEISDEFSSIRKANQLTNELLDCLKGNYSFKYYAANATERSVNFGILLSYQQKWEPLNYQAGELIKTVPLAPKESRKFSKKIIVKKHRSEKEQEESVKITKSDTSDTSRAETEIINKAANKTTFDRNSSSNGGVTEGPINGSNTTTLNLHNEAERDSQQTKRDFHESVLKAANEYKNERKVEIATEESEETETNESGEISNPNDELTVTYLFYELQRQFKISERLYRLRPVVLVAQEMPAPHEIDNRWIIAHDWIIKRVLLDDSFRYALECIYTINGEKLLLDELIKTVKEQRQIVKDLRQNVKFYTDEAGRQNRLMMRAIGQQADIEEGSDIWDDIPGIGKTYDVAERALSGLGNFLGMGGGDDEKEAARIRREGATAAYERAERERKELMSRLENETNELNGLTKAVALKRKEIIEKELQIARLREHLMDNILYYMQNIWSYEYRDQRFFRLLDTKVPVFDGNYKIKIKVQPETRGLGDFAVEDKIRHAYTLEVDMEARETTLKEVADLDNLLGFKGNYMIFPLNKSNILTDFMMTPYLDSEFGLTDPDALGNWSLDDFEQYVRDLRIKMGDAFSIVEDELKQLYKELLQDPLRKDDLITVPTGSLFIEALPGSHTILEYFKLAHRFEDVKKVQAEVRGLELENIRYAARLLENEHGDPKVDKMIVVDKNLNGNINVTE